MRDLKPCPFCGGRAKARYAKPLSYVQCVNCKTYGLAFCDEYEEADGKEKAIDAWNRRANNEP